MMTVSKACPTCLTLCDHLQIERHDAVTALRQGRCHALERCIACREPLQATFERPPRQGTVADWEEIQAKKHADEARTSMDPLVVQLEARVRDVEPSQRFARCSSSVGRGKHGRGW